MSVFKHLPVFLLTFPFLSAHALSEPAEIIKSDVLFYDLETEIDPEKRTLSGRTIIHLKALTSGDRVNLNLSEILTADSIILNEGTKLEYTRERNLVKILLPSPPEKGESIRISFYYHGKPAEAENPPWKGGIVWEQDSTGRTWAGVSCEGEGASIWWPCKEDWSDKADSARLSFIVPSGADLISNGKPLSKEALAGNRTRHTWQVSYPISTYNVTFYLGSYSHFSDTLYSGNTRLPLDFYVLDYNLDKAKEHFSQVNPVLEAFQELFGAYPFPEDGYALAEAPYWGMEHQSAIAYGNRYRNDVMGMDFIIIHETAHEWWGNSLTASDHGEMWIHEAFATYAEALLFEKTYGSEAATKYLIFQRSKIENNFPILGPLNENFHDFPDADMYYKGSWMLHSLRNMIRNDSLWFASLEKLQKAYRHGTISTKDVITFFSRETGANLNPFFRRFLEFAEPPELIYHISRDRGSWVFSCKWDSRVSGFNMPVEFRAGSKTVRMDASTDWKSVRLGKDRPEIIFPKDKFYYTYTRSKKR